MSPRRRLSKDRTPVVAALVARGHRAVEGRVAVVVVARERVRARLEEDVDHVRAAEARRGVQDPRRAGGVEHAREAAAAVRARAEALAAPGEGRRHAVEVAGVDRGAELAHELEVAVALRALRADHRRRVLVD